MSRIGIWFWDELLPNHTYSMLCGFWLPVLLRCFAEAARKLRGSTAEETHAQTTVLPADALQDERTSPKPKMKANEGPKGQNERKWNQPGSTTTRNLGKRSGAVVAEAKTKKTRSRKLAEGFICEMHVAEAGAVVAEGLRKMLRKQWIISFPPQRKKTKLI